MLTAIFLVPLLILGASLVLLAPVLARLFRRCEMTEITPEWLKDFSVSAYYPMQGLLSDEDFHFLVRQPGFDFSLYRKLRRERLLIFHQYSRRLVSDFNRLHTAARFLIARGQEDRSDLMMRLFKLKMRFSFAVLQSEISYLCCRIGIGTLVARNMIARLEEMSLELNSLADPKAVFNH
jgi:hypothetical protein